MSHVPDSWLLQTIRSLCDVDPEDIITQMYRPESCASRGTSGSVELHKMLFFLTGLSAAPWKFKSVADLVLSDISTYQCIVIPDGTQWVFILVDCAQTATVGSVMLIGTSGYTILPGTSWRLASDRKAVWFLIVFVYVKGWTDMQFAKAFLR